MTPSLDPLRRQSELTAGLFLVLLSWGLHWEFSTHAGALWRDEATSLGIATTASMGELWRALQFESFPIVWPLALRSWTHLGPGESDVSLRLMGLTFGMALAPALWFAARRVGSNAPLISLLLVSMNAILIRYGDSIRGHGLGMILFSFAFGQIWQATKHPTAAKTTAAGALALLAIHTSYYNVILVGATSVGALVVCLRNGRRRNAIALISIGTAMAMSMLIYIPASRAVSSWNASLRHGVDGSLLWGTLTDVMAHGGPHLRAIWVAFLAVAAGILISHVAGLVKLEPDRSDAVIFGGVTLLTGLVGYTFFLLMLGYYTHPWYFVSMLLLVAICCDVILQQGTVPPHSAAYAIAAAILAVMMFAPVQLLLAVPQTNIDAVALELHDKAQQSDLILVREWELGISFQRYYHGSAEWMTLPPLEDHRWHRYDLFRAAHTDSSWWPIVNQRFRQTIESGGAIWVVAGGLLETDCARAHVGEAFDILVFPSHFLEIQTRQDRIWRPANRAAAYENVIVERRISCK